jgi:uncharacterized SAM-binding protein YcdF (DUF218 family)
VAEHSSSGRRGLSRKKHERSPTHRPSLWAGAISILILLSIAGIRFYGDNLYDYQSNPPENSLKKDGAIICLAGGKYRIETAFSLYASGVGEKMYIVGAGKKATKASLAKLQAVETAQKIPWDRYDRILVETESRNTIENAFAVKRYLEQNPQINRAFICGEQNS